MLAILTTDSLVFSDPAVLKRSPALLPTSCSVLNPIASAWVPDNSSLLIAFQRQINKYDPNGDFVEQVYSVADGEEDITPSIASGTSLVFATGNKIHVMPAAGSGNPPHTFETHKSAITSLSLSNDSVLLALASGTAVHVHNLSSSSHVTLRGLPTQSGIVICMFSPHSRTSLIVAIGDSIYIYDTTKPSSPIKTISMAVASGDIIAVSCSPFSKNLIAAACSDGTLGLADLEKEKGVFKTIDMNVPLTSLEFSPEGAAVYLGTEDGTLLVQDLRSLDKAPKSISVSENSQRISCLTVQQKVKIRVDPAGKSDFVTSTSKPLTQQDLNQKPVPVRKASASKVITKAPVDAKPVPSPVRATPVRKRAISGALGGFKSPPVKPRSTSTVVNPMAPGGKKITSKPAEASALKSPTEGTPADTPVDTNPKQTVITSTQEKKIKVSPLASSSKPSTAAARVSTRRAVSTAEPIPLSQDKKPTRQRTTSIKSGISTSTVSPKTRVPAGSVASPASGPKPTRSRPGSSASQQKPLPEQSPPPPVPPLPTKRLRTQSTPSPARITGTPNLPSPSIDPITPYKGKKVAAGVLGLTTPEPQEGKKTLSSEQTEAKRQVGFTLGDIDDDDLFDEQDKSRIEEVLEEEDEEAEAERRYNLRKQAQESGMQVSPMRPSTSARQRASWAAVPSPLRRLSSPATAPGSSSSAAGAHNMLHTVMRDVMYDYQEDMRTEMMGMHLDMVRMGRDWKREMKDMMDVYTKDLRELREENRLLREENERLRRGY